MTTETHEATVMAEEMARAQSLLQIALSQIDHDGGSLRFFNAALLAESLKLFVAVEGIEALESGFAKHAAKLIEANAAGRA